MEWGICVLVEAGTRFSVEKEAVLVPGHRLISGADLVVLFRWSEGECCVDGDCENEVECDTWVFYWGRDCELAICLATKEVCDSQ